ncbi:EpsG family protein [Flavobacterium ranwuense]|uniref:EpsG family protein n=1 Tax=Flavobacterium ranwuense TaxID=2541725 RepID=A0ABY2DQX7_9FLAO|nr:EpsG family protein [Flavobacterium ranwuense]TDE29160.1 EpsG family protein [Flavobacterium ranwuense]
MIKKVDLINLLVFVVSPFFAIPGIIYGVINKSKISLILFILLFGLISFMYIPNFSDDRSRYFEIYDDFSRNTFSEMFFFFILSSQDFILQSLFYWASRFSIPAQFVFAFVTMFSISGIFFIYHRILDGYNLVITRYGLLSLLLMICSISYLDLLSGTRFMFAASFVLLAFYFGIVERKNWVVLLLIIASFIHFSTLIFLPLYLVLKIFSDQYRSYKIIFLISLFFIVLPKTAMMSIFELLGVGGALQQKGESYLGGEDFIESGINGSFGAVFIYYISLIWIFLGYGYLLFTLKRNNVIRNIVLLIASLINIFYSTPTIFLRYAIILKIFFVFMLISELYQYQKSRVVYFFCIIFSVILGTQIIIARNNIDKSFINPESLLLITIIGKDKITPNDFID